MASSSVAIATDTKLDFRKMNKQELRDALASRGLDTNGLRPLLIQRLESNTKASAAKVAAAAAVSASTAVVTKLEDSVKPHASTNPQESVTAGVAPTQTGSEYVSNGSVIEVKTEQKETLNIIPQAEEIVSGNKNVFITTKETDAEADMETTTSPGLAEKDLNGFKNSIALPLSDLDKKRRRAERFGVGLKVSEEEKLALRAERFSGVQGKKNSVQEPESEKRKQRAARFGIGDESVQKKSRQEPSKQEESIEDKKRQARASRFGGEQTDGKANAS